METYKKYRSALGYVPAEDSPIDSYGVDHSGFTTQDEVAYQNARVNRENELINRYNQQGINENYPQHGVGFWGDATNNYGFGHTNIGGNIDIYNTGSVAKSSPATGINHPDFCNYSPLMALISFIIVSLTSELLICASSRAQSSAEDSLSPLDNSFSSSPAS